MTVTTLARYEVDPESIDAVLEDLAIAARATNAETGNLYFHAFRTETGSILLIEGWDSWDSLDNHRKTEHFNSLVLGKIAPRLISRQVEILTPAFDGEFS